MSSFAQYYIRFLYEFAPYEWEKRQEYLAAFYEAEGWMDVSDQLRRLNKDMYILHAEGRSMEPKIHDGDLCVFEKTAGSHQGKIVLAKAKDELDPNAGSYTIKKYSSEKCTDENGGWHHTRVILSPLNPEFYPIAIDVDGTEDGDFQIYGELIHVIPQDILKFYEHF